MKIEGIEEQYLDLLDNILTHGKKRNDRTGVGTFGIFGAEIRHDMSEGFPLLTTRRIHYKPVRVELEGFIHGVTDKKWYQDTGCQFWDNWARKDKIPYSTDPEVQQKMLEERDLGPIYGFAWRHFGADYIDFATRYTGQGVDQLKWAMDTLRKDPNSRKVHVSAWDPKNLPIMGLEPCHYGFTLNILDGKLNLVWDQRSVDTPKGLASNIPSYATLLHLAAKELGVQEGILVGHLEDVHVYLNQVGGVKEQLKRKPVDLPRIETPEFTSIFDWNHTQTKAIGYHPNETEINFGKIAV